MDGRQVVLMFLLGAAVCGFASCRLTSTESMAHSHYKAIMKSLIVAHEPWAEQAWDLESKYTLLGFSFTNCGDAKKERLIPANVNVSPDPIKLPGNVTVSGSMTITKNISAPVKAALEVYTKVFGAWVKAPCLDNVGSCTYDDLCKLITVKKCPAALVKIGLGCKCPFPAGKFTAKPTTLHVGVKVPVSGEIKIHAELSQGKELITCAEVVLKLG